MKEADLYPPIKAHFEARGYVVKGEVGAADVVAMKEGAPPLIVELKTGFSLTLFHQAIARQAVTEDVWVAVPDPKQKRAMRANVGLARRLGLGVLTVRGRDGHVTEWCAPGPFQPRRSKKKAERLSAAFARLRGDPNEGGATRHGLVTGYRQDALACARFLAVHGPSKGATVAEWTEVPPATRIMADNHYGWFVRVSRGVYGLSAEGRKGLADWAEE